MGWLGAWIAGLTGRHGSETLPLYNAVVLRAREPHWYLAGAVPDTVDGRFDMVAAVLSAVLLRMEEDPAAAIPSARLTERFVEDMDGQLRQLGIGDIVVGKHIGKMMSMLGGRLGAYRDGFAAGQGEKGDGGAALGEAVVRNVYRGQAPAPAALEHVRDGLAGLRDRLAGVSLPVLLAGELP
ncbi:ubiquinol-cytochrome C chaperone family protein [uncultured Sphingomonas sp.]|uniref:ubiquinol-cytochrome C chaperone family protein n=1 Tax=uncultured Sphingomonas sp. TaxID=158754 RepID=UPI0035CC1EDF